MDLRAVRKPLKEKYRSDPNSSRITLRAQGDQSDTPISCSGTAACSGDSRRS